MNAMMRKFTTDAINEDAKSGYILKCVCSSTCEYIKNLFFSRLLAASLYTASSVRAEMMIIFITSSIYSSL